MKDVLNMIIASTDIIRGSHNFGETMTSHNLNEVVDFIQNNNMNNLNCNIYREGSNVILTSLHNTDTGFISCNSENQAAVIYEIFSSMNIHNV